MPKFNYGTDNSNAYTRTGVDRSYQTAHLTAPALKEITERNGLTREALATALNVDLRHTTAVLMALESSGKVRRRNGIWEAK